MQQLAIRVFQRGCFGIICLYVNLCFLFVSGRGRGQHVGHIREGSVRTNPGIFETFLRIETRGTEGQAWSLEGVKR